MANNTIVLYPRYYKEFNCIGSACEDTCCQKWNIDIDKKTYSKYRKIKGKKLTDEINKHIKRNRINPGAENYARIKLDESGKCPFLSQEKLCGIQLKEGIDYLSKLCITYPRGSNIVDGVLEKTLFMSCPEVARTILLNPNMVEFDEIEETDTVINMVNINVDTRTKNTNIIVNNFWKLRIFTIRVIQNRMYTIEARLLILGMFFSKLKEKQNISEYDITDFIDSFIVIIEDGSFKSMLKEIPANFAIQMELIKEFTDERLILGVSSKAYSECLEEFSFGLSITEGSKVEDIALRYEAAYREYYRPFMEKHEYIVENYLVNYLFLRLFPLGMFDDVFDNYAMMILHYSMIKMFLIGMSAYYEKLNEEMIIKLIYSFSRTIEHNEKFLKLGFELLKNNSYNTLPYMSILIKN